MGPNPQQGMYPYANNPYPRMPYGGFGMNVNQYPFNQTTQHPFALTKLSFLATLELRDLSKLTNDPIWHHFVWPPAPVKIPTDILMFDGKTRKDPTNHITTYHMWCVSNSFLDDSIKLWLFPRTLTGNVVKWFIKLLVASLFISNPWQLHF